MPFSSISIGNACVDLFVSVKGEHNTHENNLLLNMGKKYPMSDAIVCVGGGACNTSVGLSRLGIHATFAGIISDDAWGEHIERSLQKEGVNTDGCTFLTEEMTSVSLIIRSESGERIILSSPGPNHHFGDSLFDIDLVKKVDCVYVNRLTDHACMIEDDIITVLNNAPLKHVTWNPGGCQISRGIHHESTKQLLKHTNLLLLNKEEAMEFTSLSHEEEILKCLQECGVHTVCITNGKYGAIAIQEDQILWMPTDANVHIVDTTGAGDAFGVGMTWALLRKASLHEVLQSGTINALSVVATLGAETGLLTEEELKRTLTSTSLAAYTLSDYLSQSFHV